MTQQEWKLAEAIAARFVALQKRLGMAPDRLPVVVAVVLYWHTHQERLRLDMLADPAQSADVDFAHDLGGIMRGDRLQSARYAECYHPRAVVLEA